MTLAQRQLSSNLVKLALVALAYWSGGWLTLHWMKLGADTSPLWLPAGISLSALLIYGEGIWLGIFLGDTLLMLTLGVGWGVVLSSAIGSTLSGIIGLKLLRWSEFSPRLSRIKDVTGLIFLAGMVASLVHVAIDTLTQFTIGSLSWQNFSQKWWLLWLGDCGAILVITPFLLRLIFNSRGLFRQQSRERIIEVAICGGLLLGLSWLVFVHHGKSTFVSEGGLTNPQYLEYLPFPLVVWAAIRFQTWGAVLGSLLVSIFAIVGTLRGIGPFVIQTLNLTQATFLLQFFIIIINGTALLLSATVIEKQRTEKHLRVTLERDRLLAEVSLRIRQSFDLKQIFQTTVAEIRQLIHADRVFITSLKEQGMIEVVAESVQGFYPSLLEGSPRDDLFTDIQSLFNDYQPFIASDLTELELPIVVEKYIKYYQVKAALVVPLHLDGKPLGLLVAHQCSGIRYWQKSEVKLLEQLATQMIIAMQQAQLYQQVQELNSNLEKQVEERTHQLQEKIQEVQELYEMKAVFLQAVSHDLRTSIMGMLMLLNNLQNRPGDNLTLSRSILERMINSSDRQLTLINALSENHFAEERQLVIHCQPLFIKEFISQLVEDWQPLLSQNQATLSPIIADNLPPIYADAEQLDQVFEHLLTNALKHNPPGINLTIEATVNQGMMCCRLRDNGIGMKPEQCEQLFKLYLRSLHDRRRTGIGLGSYQCRQIIEAHGGKIGVNSSPGQGCEVWFTLPIAKSQPSAVS